MRLSEESSESTVPPVEVRVNPKICELLRRNVSQPPSSKRCPPVLKGAIGSAALERLQHENFQLGLKEVLAEPVPRPTVRQDVALNHFCRRAHNSLRSREMLAKVAREENQLRQETSAQILAKDISRRHFRTAARFDTGSKYPKDTYSPHAPEVREPLLILLQNRKLHAMADFLLAHPDAKVVGPQPQQAMTTTDQPFGDGHASPHDGSSGGGSASSGTAAGPFDEAECAAAESRVVGMPALEATLYALSLFSPRHGFRADKGSPGHSSGDDLATLKSHTSVYSRSLDRRGPGRAPRSSGSESPLGSVTVGQPSGAPSAHAPGTEGSASLAHSGAGAVSGPSTVPPTAAPSAGYSSKSRLSSSSSSSSYSKDWTSGGERSGAGSASPRSSAASGRTADGRNLAGSQSYSEDFASGGGSSGTGHRPSTVASSRKESAASYSEDWASGSQQSRSAASKGADGGAGSGSASASYSADWASAGPQSGDAAALKAVASLKTGVSIYTEEDWASAGTQSGSGSVPQAGAGGQDASRSITEDWAPAGAHSGDAPALKAVASHKTGVSIYSEEDWASASTGSGAGSGAKAGAGGLKGSHSYSDDWASVGTEGRAIVAAADASGSSDKGASHAYSEDFTSAGMESASAPASEVHGSEHKVPSHSHSYLEEDWASSGSRSGDRSSSGAGGSGGKASGSYTEDWASAASQRGGGAASVAATSNGKPGANSYSEDWASGGTQSGDKPASEPGASASASAATGPHSYSEDWASEGSMRSAAAPASGERAEPHPVHRTSGAAHAGASGSTAGVAPLGPTRLAVTSGTAGLSARVASGTAEPVGAALARPSHARPSSAGITSQHGEAGRPTADAAQGTGRREGFKPSGDGAVAKASEAGEAVRPGLSGRGLPVGVHQRLLADDLQAVLQRSRSLWARAERLLGSNSSSGGSAGIAGGGDVGAPGVEGDGGVAEGDDSGRGSRWEFSPGAAAGSEGGDPRAAQ